MKTAVSLPNPLFKAAEKLAKRMKVSRSELYARAIDRFVTQHDEAELTRRANEVCDKVDTSLDPAIKRSQARLLSGEKW